jgi:hypothetical protein
MPSLKETNKQFIFNLGDTNDVMFSSISFLDFNPINNHHKSRVLSCTNEIIQNITFKFRTGPNMRLIFDSFYAPRKKRRLSDYLELMCGQNLRRTFNIEHFIDLFSFSFFFIKFSFFFFFFYYFLKIFTFISWNFVALWCYILLIWKIWGFFLNSNLSMV